MDTVLARKRENSAQNTIDNAIARIAVALSMNAPVATKSRQADASRIYLLEANAAFLLQVSEGLERSIELMSPVGTVQTEVPTGETIDSIPTPKRTGRPKKNASAE